MSEITSWLVDAQETFVLFERSLPMLSGSGGEILKLNATSTLLCLLSLSPKCKQVVTES